MLESFINYLKYEKRSSEHTIKSYQTDLKQFEEFLVKNQNKEEFKLELVGYNDIRAWIIMLMEMGLNERTINRKIASLNTFYKYLQKKELREDIPTEKLQSLKITHTLPKFIQQNEIEKLLDPSLFENQDNGLQDQLILELLYGTGIRLSELIQLKIRDIDFHQKTIKVLGKRNKERIIPLHHTLVKLLKQYLQENSNSRFLITSKGGKQSYPMMIYRVVNKYLKLVTSVEQKSPHTLRHTFATHLLNEGADLNAIKDLLGHANLAATQVYTHNSFERLKKIFDKSHPKS